MRTRALLPLACAALLAACGGRADGPSPAPAPQPTCASTTLTASPLFTIATGPGVQVGSLAATPSGEDFVVTWADATWHASAIHSTANGTVVTAKLDLPGEALVAFDGTAFDLLSASSTGAALQRLGLDGAALGAAIPVDLHPAWPLAPSSSVVRTPLMLATPAGLAFTFVPGDHGSTTLYAVLLALDGTVLHDEPLIGGVVDPYYGTGPSASLALVGGHVLAETADPAMQVGPMSIVDLGWAGAATSPTIPLVGPVRTQAAGYYACPLDLLALGDAPALVWCYPDGNWLVQRASGGPFEQVWQLDPTSTSVVADGCGRIVALGATETSLSLRPWKGTPSQVTLATSSTIERSQIVATHYGFGVVWQDGGGVRLSKVGWE